MTRHIEAALLYREPLSDLAHRINAEHAAVVGALGSALAHAIAAGALLIETKRKFDHGEWLPWLTANCAVAPPHGHSLHDAGQETKEAMRSKRQRVADVRARCCRSPQATVRVVWNRRGRSPNMAKIALGRRVRSRPCRNHPLAEPQPAQSPLRRQGCPQRQHARTNRGGSA
jgi:hypothetical protein